MTRKFSCADFTFPLLPHDDVLRLIRLLGIEAVDLGIFEGRSHHPPSALAPDPEGSAARMKARLDATGLVPADVFVQTGAEPPVAAANTPDPAVCRANRETWRRMCVFAAALGCGHVTGLPGVRHAGVPEGEDWRRAVDEAVWRLAAAKEHGLGYGIEAHVGSILPDPETTLRFLDAVPGLTLTLDYGHFIYQGIANERCHPLLPHASHFHARGGAPGQLQSTVKDNTIDFPAVLAGLDRAGYTGRLCLEYVYVDWEGCNRTDNVSETVLLMRELNSTTP